MKINILNKGLKDEQVGCMVVQWLVLSPHSFGIRIQVFAMSPYVRSLHVLPV